MPAQFDLSKLSVRQFAERFRGEMIPLSNTFSYFCASVPMSEEDLKEYLEEPVAALPPMIAAALPRISILLVPYLERVNGKDHGGKDHGGKDQGGKEQGARERGGKDNNGKERGGEPKHGSGAEYVSIEKPPQGRISNATQLKLGDETVLAFALKGQEVAEYHYRFYHLLASVLGERWSEEIEARYARIVREELSAEAHGEVDEPSWRLKQGLRRSKNGATGNATGPAAVKMFRAYARQSFIDTLTLYLHGICCDIDVDTGPRQLPSRFLRKRLMALEELFPPPSGYAVFPEQLEP
jgi:hypothetical protein